MAIAQTSGTVLKDIDEYSLRVYKSDPRDPGYQRLPKCWNARDRSRCLKMSNFALTVSYGNAYSERHDPNFSSSDPAVVRADSPIPLTTGIFYFEITLCSKGNNGKSFSIGVATKTSSLSKLPGSEHSSFGYNTDGSVYHGSTNTGIKFGPRFGENDTVGCGVDFMSRSLFFTRNGIFLGKAFEGKVPASPATRLYPAIGLLGRGTRVTTNFGQRPFNYAFETHIKRERVLRENNFLDRVCKEEFAGPKMRELVSGYLVHHGYVATAQAFSRWTSISAMAPDTHLDTTEPPSPMSATTNASPIHYTKPQDETLQSRSCESHLGSQSIVGPTEMKSPKSPQLQRRHSDSACMAPNIAIPQLPGITSMLHRRRLRALCKRCQYGKAAATLNHLYPQVLERCPELLVQLRCRQLIEMMRRHAVRRGRNMASDSSTSEMAPPKVPKTGDSQHVRSACCVPEGISKTSRTPSQTTENGGMTMEVDSEDINQSKSSPSHRVFTLPGEHDTSIPEDSDEELGAGDADEDDDDGFGVEDDTGVSIDTASQHKDLSSVPTQISNAQPTGMEVDTEPNRDLTPTGTLESKTLSQSTEVSELPCLMRHVQFGRSLVNLVKQVRAKTGGLTLETERLLQQSVSLLAYPSPDAPDCPLRHLLDPAWRDAIANVINSAVLKAHDLPVQPALEQGLCSLQRCLDDQYFLEGQTLGHFLLYHLGPAKLAKIERDAALLAASNQHKLTKRHRSTVLNSHDESGTGDSSGRVKSRSVLNGYPTGRRRRRDIGTDGSEGTLNDQSLYDADEWSSSSVDDVLNKAEDEEDDDDDHATNERCQPDDSDPHEDDDDDEGEDPPSGIRTRSTDTHSSNHPRGGNTASVDQSSSGRTHTDDSRNVGHRLRHFAPVQRPDSGSSRLGRLAILTRYCPALLVDPTYARVLATLPSVPSARFRRPTNTNRAVAPESTVIQSDSISRASEAAGSSRQTRSVDSDAAPPNHYLDSAFSGFLSVYPQPAEFVAAMDAMDDAVKAYVGSLLVTEDDQQLDPALIPLINRSRRSYPRGDGPPPPPGGSALV